MRGPGGFKLLLPALVLLLSASQLSAQGEAAAQLTAVVPTILRLDTIAAGGTIERAQGDRGVRNALVLRVRANCPWRLLAFGQGEPVQVRASASSGETTTAFSLLGPGSRQQLVAGPPSPAVDVSVEYRIPPGGDAPRIEYALQALY